MFDSMAESTRTPNPPGALYLVIIPGRSELFRVFGIDAASSYVHSADVLLLDGKGLPISKPDLLLDEVKTGHHFRDGMLDLDAGIDLHEKEVAILVE